MAACCAESIVHLVGARARQLAQRGVKDQHKEGFQSMFPTAGLEVKMRRETIRGAAATPDDISGRFYANRAKALVMTYIGQFVSDGFAEWRVLEIGDVELRFFTGEVFLLADATITRIL
jgi:hypothetical protein